MSSKPLFLRPSLEFHSTIKAAAKAAGKPMNEYCLEAIRQAIETSATGNWFELTFTAATDDGLGNWFKAGDKIVAKLISATCTGMNCFILSSLKVAFLPLTVRMEPLSGDAVAAAAATYQRANL